MSLLILTRHAQSRLNLEERVNGDPGVPVELTDKGVEQARMLGLQLAPLPIDLCIHTRFGRTRRTAEIALKGREVPMREVRLLDDIDIGQLEGASTDDYRAFKRSHSRQDPFPEGESLDHAATRYARAFAELAAIDLPVVLVVCHEIPMRYALNGAAGSDSLEMPVHDVPNATPFLFDQPALERAVRRIELLTGAPGPST